MNISPLGIKSTSGLNSTWYNQYYVHAWRFACRSNNQQALHQTTNKDPQIMSHHTNHDCRKHSSIKPSAKDEEILIRASLLVSTLVSADITTSPAIPAHMDKYTISKIRLSNIVCKAYTGRFIRYQATLKPAQHAVAWIESSSPLMEIISRNYHVV